VIHDPRHKSNVCRRRLALLCVHYGGGEGREQRWPDVGL
jgi:hypothetical protein